MPAVHDVPPGPGMPSSRHIILAGLALGLLAGGRADAADAARGAGATFPQPLYEKWAKAYGAVTGAAVSYAGTGSGDGLRQASQGKVDFGGSDMPVAPQDLRAAGLMQFPSVVGGIVPVANVPGLDPGSVTLDGPTLAKAMLGAIAFWDDPAVAALNPGVPLPHLAVAPVHRSDASGTTFVLTEYLTKVSPEWRARSGQGTTVRWPAGSEAKGSEGMVQAVRGQPGALGYVEYSYAKRASLPYLNLVNAEGRAVQPTPMSFAAALAGVDWSAYLGDGDKGLTDRPGGASWPLTTATFVLVKVSDPATLAGRRTAAGYFRWALSKGGSIAEDLDYVPLPPDGVTAVQAAIAGVPDLRAVAAAR